MSGGTVTTESVVAREARPVAGRPRPQLFVALQCHRPLAAGSRHVLEDVDLVDIGRGDTEVTARRDGEPGLRRLRLELPDTRVSREHARLTYARGTWVLEDADSKNGVALNGRQVREAVLSDGDVVEIGHTFLLFRDAVVPVAGAPDLAASELHAPLPELVTFVEALARDFKALERLASSTVPLLVLGPSGTGKEVAARAVHQLSGRRGGFVALNCGALVDSLLEAELFGHRRGAFSGAHEDRPGIIRSAHLGTLFLDEIAELPPAAQVAFLRVLQEQEVRPVGHSSTVKVDVRLCAATNADLESLVAEGKFREDLYARLYGLALRMPPLCERREDLGLLIASLLARFDAGRRRRITPQAARRLFAHDWPRNVRELERCLQTTLALAGDDPLDEPHLPQSLLVPREPAAAMPEERLLAELRALLTEHGGNVAAVARAMGKAPTQVHRWIKRFDLEPAEYRRA